MRDVGMDTPTTAVLWLDRFNYVRTVRLFCFNITKVILSVHQLHLHSWPPSFFLPAGDMMPRLAVPVTTPSCTITSWSRVASLKTSRHCLSCLIPALIWPYLDNELLTRMSRCRLADIPLVLPISFLFCTKSSDWIFSRVHSWQLGNTVTQRSPLDAITITRPHDQFTSYDQINRRVTGKVSDMWTFSCTRMCC
jgi:hypothetical protein